MVILINKDSNNKTTGDKSQKTSLSYYQLKNKNMTLYKYFNVNDPKNFDDVQIADWDFNPRVHKKLQNRGCDTVGKLLRYNISTIINWSNFGNISVQNVMSQLEKFLSPESKFKIDEVDMFTTSNIEDNNKFFDTIKDKIDNLPNEIKSKKLQPFLFTYNLKYKKFKMKTINRIPKNLIIADFVNYAVENQTEFLNNNTKHFIAWINFDLKELTQKLLNPIYKAQKNTIDIVYGRLENKTLDDIGKKLQITRQRVQQIEKKAVAFFENRYFRLSHDIAMLLFGLCNGESFIRLKDAQKYLGNELAKIFFFFVSKTKTKGNTFYFDNENYMLVFHFTDVPIKVNEKEFVKNLPNLIPEDKFNSTIETIAHEKKYPADLMIIKSKKYYKHAGAFYYRYRLTSGLMFDYILKKYFREGFKISNPNEYKRFKKHVDDLFNYKGIVTQRSVDAVISRIGILCGRGKYIHPSYIHIDKDVLNKIYDFIDKCKYNVIPIKEIYESLKDEFVNTQITDHYFLKGVIKYYSCRYLMNKDYISKTSEINMPAVFDNFIKTRGSASYSEIKKEFLSFNYSNISLMLPQCPEVISVGNNTLMHSSKLIIEDADRAKIRDYIKKVCRNFPMTSRRLFSLFTKSFKDFMKRNQINKHAKLFGILKYMFNKEFYFSRPYVSLEKIDDINNRSVIFHLIEDFEEITLKELLNICAKHGIRYNSIVNLVDMIRPVFIRVDSRNFKRHENLNINESLINKVVKIIYAATKKNDGYLPIRKFSNYNKLPSIDMMWNDFLIESIMMLSDDNLRILRINTTSSEFSSAVFVNDKRTEKNINQLIVNVLRDENKKSSFSDLKQICNWLQHKGLCNVKLPEFLLSEGYLRVDDNNKLVVKF